METTAQLEKHETRNKFSNMTTGVELGHHICAGHTMSTSRIMGWDVRQHCILKSRAWMAPKYWTNHKNPHEPPTTTTQPCHDHTQFTRYIQTPHRQPTQRTENTQRTQIHTTRNRDIRRHRRNSQTTTPHTLNSVPKTATHEFRPPLIRWCGIMGGIRKKMDSRGTSHLRNPLP